MAQSHQKVKQLTEELDAMSSKLAQEQEKGQKERDEFLAQVKAKEEEMKEHAELRKQEFDSEKQQFEQSQKMVEDLKNELLKAMQEKQDFAEVTSRRMEEFDEASKKAEAESEAKLNEVNIDYEAKLADMGNKLLATEAVANAAAEKQQKELNTRAYMMGERTCLFRSEMQKRKQSLRTKRLWPWRTWSSNRNLWSTRWQNRVPVRKKSLSKSWVTGTV